MKKIILVLLIGMLSISLVGADKEIETGIAVIKDDVQVIEMTVDRYGWHPATFVIQKDIPVNWQINGKDLTPCNEKIVSEDLGLKFDVAKGIQTQQFSCWMDMIPGKFIVVEDLSAIDSDMMKESSANAVPDKPKSGCGSGCGMGCGSKK